MKCYSLIAMSVITVLVAGCASQGTPDLSSVPDEGSTMAADDESSVMTGSGDGSGLGVGEEFDDFGQIEEALEMVIYFDFDQSDLRSEYSDLLQRHSARLADNRRTRMRLEGHADERGSREYNIGLGERRSQAVRRLLLVQGASANQISTVSFGEERPEAFGSDEESWQLNRRVEIKYLD